MTKGKTKIYNFRFDDDFIAAMDEWRERQPFPPSRTDLIKVAVHAFIGAPDFRKRKAPPSAEADPKPAKKKAAPKNGLTSSDLVE